MTGGQRGSRLFNFFLFFLAEIVRNESVTAQPAPLESQETPLGGEENVQGDPPRGKRTYSSNQLDLEARQDHPLLRRRDAQIEIDFSDLFIKPPTLWMTSVDSLRYGSRNPPDGGNAANEFDRGAIEAATRSGDGLSGVFFVAIGDTGKLSNGLAQVTNSLADVCSKIPVSFFSLLGDNFYPSGVSTPYSPSWISLFEEPFGHPSLQKVSFFPVLGNHDYRMSPQAQIDRFYTDCQSCKDPQDANAAQVRWRFPNVWYYNRLIYRNVDKDLSHWDLPLNASELTRQGTGRAGEGDMIVVNVHLDSNLFHQSRRVKEQLDFLESTLEAAKQEADWLFVHLHHPLFYESTKARNDLKYQNLLLPIFLRHRVDVLFAGHEHLLSLSEVNEEARSNKLVQVISGSGSKLLHAYRCCHSSGCNPHDSAPPCSSRKCVLQEPRHGFVLVQLTREQIRLYFVDGPTGSIVRHATYNSKKDQRVQDAFSISQLRLAKSGLQAMEKDTLEMILAEHLLPYPPIPRTSVSGVDDFSWMMYWFAEYWIRFAIVLLVAFPAVVILCFRGCHLRSHGLLPAQRWGWWYRSRVDRFEPVPCNGPDPLDRSCELRKLKSGDGISAL